MKTQDTKHDRTHVKRGRGRAVTDLDVAKQIIDDSLMCHVAHIQKQNEHFYPNVTPTCHWRDEDRIYWHGHAKAANVVGSQNSDVCINVAQLDGLVLARSAFHHSVNYRSVSIFGRPNIVNDDALKLAQLERFLNKISPERWAHLRPIKSSELNMTAIAWLPINECSIKIRACGVNDDEADLNWPVWAGVIPIQKQLGTGYCENEIVCGQSEKKSQRSLAHPILPRVYRQNIFGLAE